MSRNLLAIFLIIPKKIELYENSDSKSPPPFLFILYYISALIDCQAFFIEKQYFFSVIQLIINVLQNKKPSRLSLIGFLFCLSTYD